MPVTLASASRRRFLKSTLAAGVGLIFADALTAFAQESLGVDADRFVLMSDTHIDADPARINRKTNMTANLTAAVAAVLATAGPKPAGLMINGDIAHNEGLAGDYAQVVSVLKPIVDAAIPLHLGMGNHDNRERFRDAVRPASPVVLEGRQISVIETPKANWILLDTLDKTNVTPGVVGDAQLAWLKTYLDDPSRLAKPALVLIHHQPDTRPPATQPTTQPAKFNGLADHKLLMEVLLPRKQVKALIFGHTHRWTQEKIDGLHLVNLPAVAYCFAKEQTSAWTDWKLAEKGAAVTFNALDRNHEKNGQRLDLAWRA